MRPFDRCPRCDGTLLIDEWGALRCLLCCREQPGGQDRDDGKLSVYESARTLRQHFRRHSQAPVVNPVSEEIEAGA